MTASINKIALFIDGVNLYATAKSLGFDIDYKRLLKEFEGRGSLAPGSHADITVFSTAREWTYDVNQSLSRSRNTPFHNWKFKGGPEATIVAGKVVWRRG